MNRPYRYKYKGCVDGSKKNELCFGIGIGHIKYPVLFYDCEDCPNYVKNKMKRSIR